MPVTVTQALDRFIEHYLQAQLARYGDLPRLEHDPDWPSPCLQGEPDPQGLQRWQPVLQSEPTDLFERLAEALGEPVHNDIAAYYSRYWSDPLRASCATGDLSLLFVWNAEDLERLRGNLIGHLLDCRRRKRPDALFFACTEPEDYVLSIDNQSGEVLLEQPGSPKFDIVAPSLAGFIDSLRPNID
ncbi:SecY-interacting protein [Motiliproteus sediminis]|uniref:SecY-interacting protein n=1 Tax=Motiliproteus sediminis TaxID=1468178 RepID=UPI001AEFC231|nr:SecY-interacting protein [Motiliproteus sediminis]